MMGGLSWEAWDTSAGIATVLWAVAFLIWLVKPGPGIGLSANGDSTAYIFGAIIAGLTGGIFLGYWCVG